MKSTGRRTTQGSIDGRGLVSSGLLTGGTVQVLLIVAIAYAVLWLVWIYGNSLRDPRYFDGWILAGGMGLQLAFHIAVKTAILTPKSIMRWRRIHIFLGYLLIAGFISHCNFALPDTIFEWALWTGFVLVTLTGIFGTYLAWSVRARSGLDTQLGSEGILARRVELARQVENVVASRNASDTTLPLPPLPDDAWIADLYTNRLRSYFQGHRHVWSHLIGSQHQLNQVTEAIDTLSRYVDRRNQAKLAAISELVVEKDRLDFASVHLALTKGWLLIHVPVTYSLIVLTVLHIVIVYAYSSGAW